MHMPLPFIPPDPREHATTPGEQYRRSVRAHTLLDMCEYVTAERRAEISRELQTLGVAALPALTRAAAGPQEFTAALSRGLVRLVMPDEVGRAMYAHLVRSGGSFEALEIGAALLARLPYPNLSVKRVLHDIDVLARRAAESVYAALGIPRREGQRAAAERTLEIVKKLGEFWRDEGFHGDTANYYEDRNSYLPDVLERHTGLPITLSVLYLALARRLFLDADGVGLPGHFIVRVKIPSREGDQFILIDPFNGARPVNVEECKARVEATGHPFVAEEHLRATPPVEILARMCSNLLALFDQQRKPLDAERVATVLIHLHPRDPVPLLLRAERRLRRGERKGARSDLQRVKRLDPTGPIGRAAAELMRRMGYEKAYE